MEAEETEWFISMRSSARWIVALLGCLLGAAGSAAAPADDEASAAAPGLTRTDTPGEPQRSLPGYRSEVTELSYRWWASSGRADLGLGLGTMTYVARPSGSLPGVSGDGSQRPFVGGTVVTMGMRYRTSERSAVFADASGVHGTGLDGGDAVVGKLGFEFKSAQSRWNVSYGGLGLHLAGDARMDLRLRRGGLAIAVRSSF